MPNYRRRNTFQNRKPTFDFRMNEQIRADEIRMVDEEGGLIGVYTIEKALEIATERQMDLIEINPKALPPIVKLIPLSKFKYQLQKKTDKQKSPKSELKNIRVSVRTSIHDLEVRARKIKEFLEDGHKVHLDVNMRGREQQYPDIAAKQINLFLEVIAKIVPFNLESPAKQVGSRFTCSISPKAS